MATKTVVYDGTSEIEMKDYDAFQEWKGRVIAHFEGVKNYAGYPSLPEFWLEGQEIYARASEREKRMIANCAISTFMACLQHWRPDMDTLYDPVRRKKYDDEMKIIDLFGKQYSPRFYLG